MAEGPTGRGFSDVDGTGRADGYAGYLALLAARLGRRRTARYPLLALAPGGSVLDVGCGTGATCLELADLVAPGGRVVGVDVSEALVAAGRRASGWAASGWAASGRWVELVVADAARLPFPDGTFDAAWVERVLQHVVEPGRVVSELARVVRPGGRIVLDEPNHHQHDLATDHPERWAAIRAHGVGAVRHPRSGLALRQWLVEAGVEVERVETDALLLDWPEARPILVVDNGLAAAVEKGALTAAEGRAFLAEQDARHRAGTFTACAVAFTAVGRVASR